MRQTERGGEGGRESRWWTFDHYRVRGNVVPCVCTYTRTMYPYYISLHKVIGKEHTIDISMISLYYSYSYQVVHFVVISVLRLVDTIQNMDRIGSYFIYAFPWASSSAIELN